METHDEDKHNAIHINVDSEGNLTAETQNAISSASASLKASKIGSKLNFKDMFTSIAASVKSGNISFGISYNLPQNITLSMVVSSDNIAPKDSGIDEHMSVRLDIVFSLSGPKYVFKKPNPQVSFNVATVIGIALVVGIPFVAASVLTGGLIDELIGVGILAAA